VERQLDCAYSASFTTTRSPLDYRSWLANNGVRYVALPDTQLDDSSLLEQHIILQGQPYLRYVWDAPAGVEFTRYRSGRRARASYRSPRQLRAHGHRHRR
jgi:hypothetical protein